MSRTLDNRVLGRVLAVEEIAHVSGAKPTSPCHDNITAPSPTETSLKADCVRSESERGGSVVNVTGVMLDQEIRR